MWVSLVSGLWLFMWLVKAPWVCKKVNCYFNQGGSNEKILVGPSLSNDDVIRAMTSLLPPSIQNIGGAAAPVAPPVATPLVSST